MAIKRYVRVCWPAELLPAAGRGGPGTISTSSSLSSITMGSWERGPGRCEMNCTSSLSGLLLTAKSSTLIISRAEEGPGTGVGRCTSVSDMVVAVAATESARSRIMPVAFLGDWSSGRRAYITWSGKSHKFSLRCFVVFTFYQVHGKCRVQLSLFVMTVFSSPSYTTMPRSRACSFATN